MTSHIRASCMFVVLSLAGCTTVDVNDKVSRYNEVGLNDFAQGRFSNARECFAAALELTPNDAHLLLNLAECDDRIGDCKRAEHYYVECLRKAPGNVEARYALVMLYYRNGDKAQAARLVDEWFAEQPGSAEPLALEGWRLRQERDFIGAREKLMQALARDHNNVHAMTELAILYETMHEFERALDLYERSLARNPNQPEVIQRLALLKSRNIGRPRPD